jgi:poly(hydroxyalkanoate) depolymerase family esterase
MAKRITNPFLSRSFQRTLNAMTRTAIRVGTKTLKKALHTPPAATKPPAAKKTPSRPLPTTAVGQWTSGSASGVAGAKRYRLFKPPGVQRGERLPLMVMLHGCLQDAQEFADVSQMNRIAARERFFVLYPEQDRLSNAQRCWNWFETRSGRAQSEADAINATIDQVCMKQAIDPGRMALAGMSAGASMATLMVTRHPARFQAVAMHSGIGPGVAYSSITAFGAMRGHQHANLSLSALPEGQHLPALLIIQGSSDTTVAPGNGLQAAHQWADTEGAKSGVARTVQRGARYAAHVTDFKVGSRLVSTLCEVRGLGHAWSGGASGCSYSDPRGPDASRMIWTFVSKQFTRTRPTVTHPA